MKLSVTEARRKIIELGLDPELTKRFLEDSIANQRRCLALVGPMLSHKDATLKEMEILNGEMLLSVFRIACI